MAETKKTNAADDLGRAEVQARFDKAEAKGYFGESPDKTPAENYTLKGVIAGKPTPETDHS